ncbi:MAG: hypothetical protein M1820_001376 [Bogoriella megaspora]|nr:MAG: hypothetical protein M1820_001376 [Bogoriella megaspora]
MPTPKILGAPSAAKPDFVIIPNSEFIVFHGGEHEAGEIELSGKVVLSTPEALSFKTIKVALEGKRKISWVVNSVTGTEMSEKKTFYHEEKNLTFDASAGAAHKLHRGQHVFPFKFLLTGAMPESVEGMNNAWIVYTLHARIERGYLTKDLTASRHIRIVRTLGQDEREMVQSRTNSDIWTNKVSYNISVPSDAYIFGTGITADVELTPIRKGLGMGKIELQLVEKCTLKMFSVETVPPGFSAAHQNNSEREVAKVELDFPEDSKIIINNPDPDSLMDEMYKFPLHIKLPKSLKDCRQNVSNERIKIEHVWRLKINLHNPEGHVSQLVCKIPIKIFISPNLPINQNQDVCPGPNQVEDAVINQQETTLVPPPEYGAHQLDQLYHDIDTSGFMTPRPGGVYGSGSTTPFYSRSRANSSENLPSLGHLTVNDGISGPDMNVYGAGGVSASAIQTRLSHLQQQDPNQLQTSAGQFAGADLFSNSNSRSGRQSPSRRSRSLSRHPSDERRASSSTLTVPVADYDLSRVPSYNTAVQTPRPSNPADTSLPTYEVATSRPPTPEIQLPGQAHIRDDRRRRGTDDQDEEARLTLLRAGAQ